MSAICQVAIGLTGIMARAGIASVKVTLAQRPWISADMCSQLPASRLFESSSQSPYDHATRPVVRRCLDLLVDIEK